MIHRILRLDIVHGFRAYDRAAIKFRGVDADINFNISDYEDDMKQVSEHQLFRFFALISSIYSQDNDGNHINVFFC